MKVGSSLNWNVKRSSKKSLLWRRSGYFLELHIINNLKVNTIERNIIVYVNGQS